MRLITREEMEAKPLRGRGHSSKVFREVLSMEVGQILEISAEDWGTRKYPPTRVVRYIEKHYTRKYKALRHAVKKEWVVERIS